MGKFDTDRRSILGGGMLLAGSGALAAAPARAFSQSGAAGAPAAEELDSWLDQLGRRHRLLFDTTSIEAGTEALGFANNFIHENQAAYGLAPEQLGIVIVLRHFSTPLAYNDSVWAKYGKGFAEQLGIKGELAKRAATRNPVLGESPTPNTPPGFGWFADNSLAKLSARGVRYAVCGLATQVIAGMVAGKTGAQAAAVEAEFKSNLVPGAVMVPAGIVAVNRAQEKGYTFAYVG